jgi:hypothetical protein
MKIVNLHEGPRIVNLKSGSVVVNVAEIIPLVPGGPGAGTSAQPPTKVAVKTRR